MSLSLFLTAAALAAAPIAPPPPVPGDGLSLAPPQPASPEREPVGFPPSPPSLPTRPFPVPPWLSIVPAGLLAAVRPRGSEDASEGPEAVVVLVPGFGSPASGTFDDLVARAGIGDDAVVEFDWRRVTGDPDHEKAASRADVAGASDGLEAFIEEAAGRGRPVYLVGHSKGGALIAALIARWDADPSRRIDAVRGAMLLDPPIADGPLGRLQRAGLAYGLPNNGGYDPMACGWWSCHDTRAHLGADVGVEVVVVRNPDAVFTNFADEPPGLRVYDLEDGGGLATERIWGEGSVLERVGAAHAAPLHHDGVAACLSAEIAASGSCRWDAAVSTTRASFHAGGGGAARFRGSSSGRRHVDR